MKLLDFRLRFTDDDGEIRWLHLVAHTGRNGDKSNLSIGIYKKQGGGLKFMHERDATKEEAQLLLQQVEEAVMLTAK